MENDLNDVRMLHLQQQALPYIYSKANINTVTVTQWQKFVEQQSHTAAVFVPHHNEDGQKRRWTLRCKRNTFQSRDLHQSHVKCHLSAAFY